jgi:hypothetical protein
VSLAAVLIFSTLVTPSGAETPENVARELLVSGLRAVEAGNRESGRLHLEAARGLDPFIAELYYNLGLLHLRAESELLAIPYWQSYLALADDSARRKRVEDALPQLLSQAELRYQMLLTAARAAAATLPVALNNTRKELLIGAAFAQAAHGEIDVAARSARSAGSKTSASRFWRHWGQYRLSADDSEGALQALRAIKERVEADQMLWFWGQRQLQRGDWEGVRRTARFFGDPHEADALLRNLAWAMSRELQPEAAVEVALAIQSPSTRRSAHEAAVLGFAKTGRQAEAAEAANSLAETNSALAPKALDDVAGALAHWQTKSGEASAEASQNFFLLALVAAWKNDLRSARAACEWLRSQAVNSGPNMGAVLCAQVAIEERDTRSAIDDLSKLDGDVANHSIASVFWRHIARREPDEAEQLARKLAPPRLRARLLFEAGRERLNMGQERASGSLFDDALRLAMAAGVPEVVEGLRRGALAGLISIDSKTLKRASQVALWMSYANYLTTRPEARDLGAYLEDSMSRPVEERGTALVRAAEAWGGGITQIEALQHRWPQSARQRSRPQGAKR